MHYGKYRCIIFLLFLFHETSLVRNLAMGFGRFSLHAFSDDDNSSHDLMAAGC